MLSRIIQWSLRNRLLVVIAAVALLIYGGYVTTRTPVDVFPDLTAPTVTFLTISSITASLVVALTVTPVLCYFLLGRSKLIHDEKDSRLVTWLKKQYARILNWTLRNPYKIIASSAAMLLVASGNKAGYNGDQTLEAIVDNCKVLEITTPLDQLRSGGKFQQDFLSAH